MSNPNLHRRAITILVSRLAIAAGLLLPGYALAQQASLVRVDTVRMIPVNQTVPVLGRLVARRAGDVAARVAGRLNELYAEEGDQVQKGQIIARLNTDTLEAEVHLAMGALDEAKAGLKIAKAETELARRKMTRQENLQKSAAFSKARYEDAKLEIIIAESKATAARARIATAKATVDRRKLDLRHADIYAPYNGVIIQSYGEVGGYVRAGDRVARMIGIETLEVEADVPSNRLAGLEIDREIDITLDDGSAHKAIVRALLPAENPLTRTRAVRFSPSIGDTDRPLAEGQSVTVLVPLGAKRNVLGVHKDAILTRQGSSIVYVITDGSAELRKISIGDAIGAFVTVIQGLKDGESVVVRGNERLQPGAKIRIDKSGS